MALQLGSHVTKTIFQNLEALSQTSGALLHELSQGSALRDGADEEHGGDPVEVLARARRDPSNPRRLHQASQMAS